MADGGWVATYEDITDRRQAEARIAHLAHHDVLTDLPNRALFLQRLEEALTRVRRHGESVAVISLDLDRFKSVNDTLGHPVGDQLLCEVARRLIGCLRDTDTVARFGGDEFAILQIGREQPRDADALARRIADVIGAPYDLDGNEVVVGTSLGISVAPGDGLEADELLKNAEMALYRAKSDGRGAHRFFEAEMDAQLQARRLMELDLRQALARDEFELHYQPLVNLRTNAIVGYEALLRWRHPERGMVSPALFIPVAEEIGLISAIGEWVIREACDEAASWPDHLKVAVNLSSVQFRGRGLVPTIVSALAASGLPAHRLELEITESVLLQDNEATLATLHQMRSLGTRIAMDDFGTGFSSLSYLRSFPFDKIKIDRSFVRDSGRPDCLAIVQSVASLAANLHMSTTAEGIETAEQLERVREAGCTEGQGFLFARPKPAHELAHVFESAAPPLLRVVRQRY
jgi:diguanylate cyclase (GGDEF)-like protein